MCCYSKLRLHCQQLDTIVLGGTSYGTAAGDEKGKGLVNLLVGLQAKFPFKRLAALLTEQ
jgi:hypothetical protein